MPLQVFPLCYVLMTSRSAKCYEDVFNFIENNILKLDPVELMTDFEAGLRKAIEKIYPHAILRGCWFHLCQALRRNAIRFGLSALLNEYPEARFILKALMSLPLLPNNRILEGYRLIKKIAVENELMGSFRHFFNYFESYWLVQVVFFQKFNSFNLLTSENYNFFSPKYRKCIIFMIFAFIICRTPSTLFQFLN